MIPFYGRHQQVAECLSALLAQKLSHTQFLLVDDGSHPAGADCEMLKPYLERQDVTLITHPENSGVSAARNSAIHWCRERDIKILLMIDSDCRPGAKVIEEHLRLHIQHPGAACIGGSIIGTGRSAWAKLDGLVSWIHASPHNRADSSQPEFRYVAAPYHLASTNFSVKISLLPERERVFDERLKTGEDCLLVRQLRQQKREVYFSATPSVYHQDRERLADVFRHHYAWGHHQYFIQLGGDLSPRCFNPIYRLAFASIFLLLLPLFALTGALLNSKALWANQRQKLWWFPAIYLLWLAKGCAVLEAALRPYACLRQQRPQISYHSHRP